MDVTEILEAHKAQNKLPKIEKLVPVEFDLNLLAGFDTNAFDEQRLKAQTESYIKELTQENTQLILNEILKCPSTVDDSGKMAELPTRISKLPREKILPKDKPLTRWEKFAKVKGIQNRKKERMVYDENLQEYVPRWGYKGSDKPKGDWLIEVPDNADPMEDQFEKKREEKKGRVERNNKRQKRNTEETNATILAGKKDVRDFAKADLKAAIKASQTATASMGKFDQAPKEWKPKTKAKGNTKLAPKPKNRSKK